MYAVILFTWVITVVRWTGGDTLLVLITSSFGFAIAMGLSGVVKETISGATMLADQLYEVSSNNKARDREEHYF